MNPKIAAFALAIGITVVIPVAAQTPEPTQPGSWVLLALDIFNGAVSPRTALPNLPKPETGEGLPTFHTRAACERALRETIKFYAYPGHVHANGAFGFYLCTDYETWKHELIGPSGGEYGDRSQLAGQSIPERDKSTDWYFLDHRDCVPYPGFPGSFITSMQVKGWLIRQSWTIYGSYSAWIGWRGTEQMRWIFFRGKDRCRRYVATEKFEQ